MNMIFLKLVVNQKTFQGTFFKYAVLNLTMAASLQKIIGKINPWLYADNGDELLKKYGSPENIPAEEVREKPLAEHSLMYDSSAESLEPIYFFILDLMNDFGLAPQKYSDNFTSSPGSGHFAELGQRMTIMQQQGTKMLGDINTVLRSILNLLYDLREFRIRLQTYDDLKSQDKNKKEAAALSLKQIWMDKVDINKGNSSIKAMALGQAGFQTLIDAFLFAKNLEDADKIDLNERVKRIVKARILEFNDWISNSGTELRKRYEIEKTYLKSQVSSLKIYSQWAKPYLRAASRLEMKEHGREPALVKVFNTLLLELTLMGKMKLKIPELALEGKLPIEFKKLRQKRDYYACIIVDFTFRGIPQRVSQQAHYAFGGKADVVFSAYALNQDELDRLDEEAENEDIGDAFRLIEGATTESLGQLKDDIEFFLEEKKEEEEQKFRDVSNPFVALIGGYNKSPKPKEKPNEKEDEKEKKKAAAKASPDTWIEKTHLRTLASEAAKDMAFKLFDVYKKAHGMPSYT
jgi:hypothetical protein